VQNINDSNIAHDYALDLPEYGGIFHDGDLLVVLMTANLAQHERELRRLVTEPDKIEVRPAARPWAAVSAGAERLSTQLPDADAAIDVTGVGIGVHDGEFIVTVGINPYSDRAAETIRMLASPEPVFIKPQAPATLLPMRTPRPSRVA
jgi:hypothetical protein